MRIGIIGSGALGLYYGAMLQRSGQDLHFLLRRDYQAIQENGLHVFSCHGDFYLPQVASYLTPQEIGPVDLVIVGLKTISNHHLIELVRPLLGDNTAILTLQNGLGNEELLATAFGPERVLGGVAFLCSNRGEPGTVHHLGEGKILLGEFRGGSSQRSHNLAEMFQTAGVPCTAVSDLRRARWEKLVWNIPFNGLSALLEKDVTEILNHPPSKELVKKLMLEVIAGANAQKLETQIDALKFSQQLISFSEKMDHYRPSMMIDRIEGRALELEAIYAIPLQQAKTANVSMPLIEMLFTLLDCGEN
ncbi:ketopantoate reductase [Desulfuromusa kysingii]|uniref:2-dehydropantoate 2-reductase n=1 Tax=Desulfuromusa kysingii TaxID=37625 RepID=A0A1H4AS62_9BACT|nr:putative 2-dehydropantoate 2-reductase [Desulfuromusa kysingii]SEA38532.1 ketopantoate reductase [Desulfuromusa kysingii]